MSHSRQTEHYGLPLYNGTDIINPLTDFNNANEAIDEAVYNANQRSVEAQENAENASSKVAEYDAKIDEAKAYALESKVEADKVKAMMAEEFDPLKDGGYKVGDIVIEDNKLYTFIHNHTGAWDGADVRETTISNILNGIVDEVVTAVLTSIEDNLSSIDSRITNVENELNSTKVELLSESEG